MKAFVRFKDLADKKKEITNADLEAIINDDQVMFHCNCHCNCDCD